MVKLMKENGEMEKNKEVEFGKELMMFLM